MAVSIHDMASMATSLPEVSISSMDIGNTIEVTDLGDDFGMSLLANKKFSGSSSSYGHESGGSSISIQPVNTVGIQEIDVGKLDALEPINLDFGATPAPTITVQREQSYQPMNTFGSDGSYANTQSSTASGIQLTPSIQRDPLKEAAEKSELINKLHRLEAKGFPVSKRFTMDNTLDEVKAEYTRLVDARQLETSIKFQRNMLMGFVTGLEWMNNKFDPFELKLDGWSEGVNENIDDYDEIFEELYDKYKEKGKMPPEARLIFQLAGSGFMCHLTNSFFRKNMPTADDIFKNNPDLARQFAAAAAQQASPGFGNFMGMAMGMPPQQGGRAPPPQAPPTPREPMGVPLGMASGPAGVFFNSPQMPQKMAAAPAPQVARREMNGPSGVDDILKTFEEIRAAEEAGPNFPSQMPTANSMTASVSAEELQSVASGDMGSLATERTNGGRRRKRQAPTGNVVSLNV